MAALACYQAANDRPATPLEVQLLGELEEEFNQLAGGDIASDGEWLVAAIREAVASGSRFVAPKRIREILNRWAGSPEDRPTSLRPSQTTAASGSSQLAGIARADSSEDDPEVQPLEEKGAYPIDAGWASVWEEALRRLARSLDQEEMERIFAGSRIVAARRDTVTIAVWSATASSKIRGEYSALVKRSLRQAAKRALVFDVVLADDAGAAAGGAGTESENASPGLPGQSRRRPGHFVLPGGLTGRQLWAAAQADLAKRISAASFESWVRPAQLLARDESGSLVLGAPNAFARSRLEPLLGDIQASLSSILETEVSIRLVVTGAWRDSADGERSDGG